MEDICYAVVLVACLYLLQGRFFIIYYDDHFGLQACASVYLVWRSRTTEGHKQYCVAANRRGFPIRESYRTICILLSEFRSKLPCYNLCWPPWAWSKPSVLISAADAHTYAALQGAWRWWAGPQPCLVRPRAAHGGLSSVPSRAVEVVPNLALSITHSLTHSLTHWSTGPIHSSAPEGEVLFMTHVGAVLKSDMGMKKWPMKNPIF